MNYNNQPKDCYWEWDKLYQLAAQIQSHSPKYYPMVTIADEEIKTHEILFNYQNYHNQFDNFNMNHVVKYYQVEIYENDYVITVSNEIHAPLGLYFSSRDHANEFIGLLKENVK